MICNDVIICIFLHLIYCFVDTSSPEYVGCYLDPDHTAMSDYAGDSSAMTIDMCVEMCRNRNFKYAGLHVLYRVYGILS